MKLDGMGRHKSYSSFSSLGFTPSFAASGVFLWRNARAPRSRSSQQAFRKKTPESVSRIKLMNRPSTVVMVPVAIVQAIPTSGMMPSMMEITSIIGSKRPPHPARIASTSDGNRWCTHRPSLFLPLFRFERGVHSLAVPGRQGHLLILLPKFFMDECQRVGARRQALDLELAIGASYRIERVLHNIDIHLHPGMLVALHRQHDLFAGEGLL